MDQGPERPFVPRRTPTKAQPAFAAADFALSAPFVPGAARADVGEFELPKMDATSAATTLPPIENFLDFSGAAAAGLSGDAEDDGYGDESNAEEEELPPVEHFTDPLPPVGDFMADAAPSRADWSRREASEQPAVNTASTDWVETDWQQYDWRSVAALGATGEREASTAWSETDWDAAVPRAREKKPTAAQAIASALDQIAQQIRDGHVALPGPGAVTDPRTIATTLAALLGMRQ